MKDFIFADIFGNENYPTLNGIVTFSDYLDGTLVSVEVANLPISDYPLGFHIHSGNECVNNFESALDHYTLNSNIHPIHTGDLPSLFSNNGYSYMSFYTNRFKPQDIVGKTVIIHEESDDFISQPSGNSGNRIACGIIKRQ